MVQAIRKNEWNNEESKLNMPFQNALSNSLQLGHKISEQAEHLWKEQVPHPLLTFYIQIITQLLQSLIIITQAERDNAVNSASDCRSGNTSSSLSPAI